MGISISTIIFDLDDTLINTKTSIMISRICVANQYLDLRSNLDIHVVLDLWARLSWFYKSDNLDIIIPTISKEMGLKKKFSKRDFDKIKEEYKKFEVENISLIPKVNEVFNICINKKIKLGIFGNGDKKLQISKMKKFPIFNTIFHKKYFIFADGYDIPHKPNSEGLELLINMMKVHPSNVIYIGDRVTDVMTAKNANCYSIQLQSPSLITKLPSMQIISDHEKADLTINSMSKLIKIMESKNYEILVD